MAKKSFNREDLIKEISYETLVRESVVEEVLEKFVDIAVEQIVNEGSFSLRGLFSINEYETKGGKIVPGQSKPLEARKTLRVKLSTNIKNLYTLQQGRFSDKPFFINRDNWKSALSWMKTERASGKDPSKRDLEAEKIAQIRNPLLEDDD